MGLLSPTNLAQQVHTTWRRATRPLDRIADPDERLFARQLSVVIAWSCLSCVLVVALLLLFYDAPAFDPLLLLGVAVCLAGLFGFVVYFKQARVVVWVYLIIMNAALYIIWLQDLTQPAILSLGFLPLLILITGAVASPRVMILNTVFNIVLITGLHFSLPQVPYLGVSIMFNGVFSTAVCVVTLARMREKESLKESEQRYRGLMEINYEPIAIFDLKGKILNVNTAFESLAKMPLSQLIGKPIYTLVDASSAQFIRDNWGKEGARMTRLTARAADGTEFPIEVRTNSQIYQGKNVFVVLVRNLSYESAFDRERREYELRYRALFDSSNDAIYVFSLEGTYITANQRGLEMLGLTMDEFMESSIFDYIVPDQVSDSMSVIRRLLNNEVIPVYQRRLRRRDGQILLVEMSPTLVRDVTGKALYIQSVVRDIGERGRAEESRMALMVQQERTKMLKQLIDDFNHHIRTPLANIKNSTYLMSRSTNTEKQQYHSQVIDSEIERLVNLLNDLLMLARLEPEAETSTSQAFDLNDVVGDVVPAPIGTSPPDDQRTWLFEPFEVPVVVFGDRNRMMEALKRLIDNARMYTPDGGTVRVAVEGYDAEGVACVTVQDSGIGIEAEFLSLVFESFFRTDAARNQNPLSTGLGLSISRKIIETHRGLITVESQPGEGATFRVWLPTGLKSVVTHETLSKLTHTTP